MVTNDWVWCLPLNLYQIKGTICTKKKGRIFFFLHLSVDEFEQSHNQKRRACTICSITALYYQALDLLFVEFVYLEYETTLNYSAY